MTVWWAAATVFVLVLAGLLAVTLFAFGVRYVVREARAAHEQLDAVEDAINEAVLICQDGSHDEYDMTDDERDAEVAWLKALYGPPVTPGRD